MFLVAGLQAIDEQKEKKASQAHDTRELTFNVNTNQILVNVAATPTLKKKRNMCVAATPSYTFLLNG